MFHLLFLAIGLFAFGSGLIARGYPQTATFALGLGVGLVLIGLGL